MKKRAFTLIEMLVVIAIIGLLASIILVSMGGARKKARDAKRQSDLRQIATAMEMCYDDPNCGAGEEKYLITGDGANVVANIDTDLNPCYLCPVPKDPLDTGNYRYTWKSNSLDPSKYCVYTQLEGTGKWIAASHKGTCFTLDSAPQNVDCWSVCP